MVWNIESGKEIKLLDFHPTTVAAVKFSHVYCMLISACQNLVVWIPDSNHQPASLLTAQSAGPSANVQAASGASMGTGQGAQGARGYGAPNYPKKDARGGFL